MAIKIPSKLTESGYRYEVGMPEPTSKMERKEDGTISCIVSFDSSAVSEYIRGAARDMSEKIDAVIMDELMRINGYVPERTCKVVGTVRNARGEYEHELSCGHTAVTRYVDAPNYCEECGCRVVNE
jgi:hypothetical protein